MFMYRVTKYDPRHRDANGAFLREDWTSACDIGRSFGGRTLTKQQYLEIENKHVETVRRLLSNAGIKSMRIQDVEVKAEGNDKKFS